MEVKLYMNKIINSIIKIFLCCSFLGFVGGDLNKKALTKKDTTSNFFAQLNHRMFFPNPLNLSQDNLEEINFVGSGLKVKGNVAKYEVRWIVVAVKDNAGKRCFHEVASSVDADCIDPSIIQHIVRKISFIKPRNSYVIYDAPEFGNRRYSICEIIRSDPDRSTLAGKKEKQAEYKEDERNIDDLLAEIEGATKKATKNRPSTAATSSGDNPWAIEKAAIIETKAKKES